jgi:hypothetical protein
MEVSGCEMERWGKKANGVDTYDGSVKSDGISSPRYVFDPSLLVVVVVAHERTCG